jgi:transcriptional regulator with XRE-family HTH domain
MEWEADRIMALRKHAGMTQAQVAQWLGVTIKQVKYLEHQRRHPSGPTRRLLSILAAELNFEGGSPVQVLGTSAMKKSVSKRVASRDRVASGNSELPNPLVDAAKMELEDEIPEVQSEPNSGQGLDGGAFVWR